MISHHLSIKHSLVEGIVRHRSKLRDWYLSHAEKHHPPFYSSIDLRDSGFKIVPVDSNLYPAGFNNICPEDIRNAPPIIRAQIEAYCPQNKIQKILVIPESHTQNKFYAENLYYLTHILSEAGFEVCLGWYGEPPANREADGSIRLESETGKVLHAWPIENSDGSLKTAKMVPDLVLLNNDFSSHYPKLFDEIRQPVVPSHRLGWHSRKKSCHFHYYNRLAAEFAGIIGMDPWFIQVDTEEVSPVNFDQSLGTELVAESVDRLISRTRAKYTEHGIERTPFAFVKNNAGTYGMGIMVVHSGDELRQLNRREKHKMSVGKNRSEIRSVVVQEGIRTSTLVDRLPAEPVIYLVGQELMGGFLRTNTDRGEEDNLNSRGMVFKKLCMSDLRDPENEFPDFKNVPVLETAYGAIARLSALAIGMEITERSGTRNCA